MAESGIDWTQVSAAVDDLRCDALKPAARNFAASAKNLAFLAVTPQILLSAGYQEAAYFEFAARFAEKRTGVVKGGFEEYWADYKARVEAAARTAEVREKFGEHLWEFANKQLDQLQMDEKIGGALRAVRMALPVFAWATFECLGGDLWEVVVNRHAREVAAEALQLMASDPGSGLTSKAVPVALLLRHGLDLREKLGTVLREKLDFSSAAAARKAFLSIGGRFPLDEEVFSNVSIVRLEALRHVIVHRHGIVDEAYHRRVPSAAPGAMLECPIDETGKLISSMLSSGVTLMKWVDRLVIDYLPLQRGDSP